MNQITINFIECQNPPANGYNILYRVMGSGSEYIDAGNFFSSPAVITDYDNPDGTLFEGVIRSDCSESGESGANYGNPVPWNTDITDDDSPGSGGAFIVRVTNAIGSYITDIQPVVYVGNAFPVGNDEQWDTVHGGFASPLTVTVDKAVFLIRSLKLFKNGIEQQSINVAVSGDYTFDPVTFGAGDNCEVRLEDA